MDAYSIKGECGMKLWALFSMVWLGLGSPASAEVGPPPHHLNPRQVMEAVVQANENRDYAGMARLMAHDDDIVNYTIFGLKYVGWEKLERDLKKEFATVERLEIPIHELILWVHEEKGYAWFSMEIDYIRYMGKGEKQVKNIMPLRETGLLEKKMTDGFLFHGMNRNERCLKL